MSRSAFLDGGRSRRTGAWFVVVLAAVVSVACAAGPLRVSTTPTDPPLLVHSTRGTQLDALITGELRYLADAECFVIEREDRVREGRVLVQRTRRHVAVWPPGTQPWSESDGLVGVAVPGVGLIRLGDWVTSGGGYASPRTSEMDLPTVDPACLGRGGEFALLQRITDVRRMP